MDPLKKFIFTANSPSEQLFLKWSRFLYENKFDFTLIQAIDLTGHVPVIMDTAKNKFSIDFIENRTNYHKKKGSIKTELISRAMGTGRAGLKILDLSAGLGIDAIFLSQLGYDVTALERNPLIYLALQAASEKISEKSNIRFLFSSAEEYLKKSLEVYDVIYFDPMFPEKTKSALPRQEMVFFKNLVGDDADAADVLKQALTFKNVQRLVVKRPVKAEALLKPHSHVLGKLVRFDIYGAKK